MSVRVQHDEANSLYELGADIDGAWVAFVRLPAETVRGTIATAKQAAAEQQAAGGANANAAGAGGEVAFNPDDYTDNSDGTFTRKGDDVQGRFTPRGFEPIQAT